MQRIITTVLILMFTFTCMSVRSHAIADESGAGYPFRMENLIPWSIVAFDSMERSPKERIEMVKRLGFSQYAFGGREKHIASMNEECRVARERGIRISAVWLYLNHNKDKVGLLKPMSESVFRTLESEGLKTQIWAGFHPEYFAGLSDAQSLQKASAMIAYLSTRASAIGCKIALYNHGGWFGKPQNQVRIIQSLPEHDLGIISNFHHSHDHLDTCSQDIKLMLPYLWCVSLNGVNKNGPQIITIGEGEEEKRMISELLAAGYQGPFGIPGHVKGGDPESILQANVAGLHSAFPKTPVGTAIGSGGLR